MQSGLRPKCKDVESEHKVWRALIRYKSTYTRRTYGLCVDSRFCAGLLDFGSRLNSFHLGTHKPGTLRFKLLGSCAQGIGVRV